MDRIKPTGYKQNVDKLGHMKIPKEIRQDFSIEEKGELIIYQSGRSIIMEKYIPEDEFTGATDDLISYCGKWVSRDSIRAMCEIARINLY